MYIYLVTCIYMSIQHVQIWFYKFTRGGSSVREDPVSVWRCPGAQGSVGGVSSCPRTGVGPGETGGG